MGIHRDTLNEWKSRFPDISDSLKIGRENADYIVENELFESCKTRTVTVKKPIKLKKVMVDGKKRLEEERVEYVEEQVVVPANVTAQIFYLKNVGLTSGLSSMAAKKMNSTRPLRMIPSPRA